jgi:hypothetical protein
VAGVARPSREVEESEHLGRHRGRVAVLGAEHEGGVDAAELLREVVAEVDQAWPDTRPTYVQVDTGWPAYALPDNSPLRAALMDAARSLRVGPAGMALCVPVAHSRVGADRQN